MATFEIDCAYCVHRHEVTGRHVVAFSGSRRRYWSDEGWIFAQKLVSTILYHLREKYGEPLVVKVGDANGIDALVREYCDQLALCYEVLHANWKDHGSFAGHERNGRVILGADELIAIMRPGRLATPGTGNAVYQADRAGIIVHEWRGTWLR